MKIINYLNRTIEYSFYALFLLVPLIFTSATSELFELPKMWLVFGLTLIISASWGAKMILQGQFRIQRTPLDIPIILFLISQIASTIFSLDPHVSLWGYYSRFNGGLLSIISYSLLYYAFVTNLTMNHVVNVIKISLLSGLLVALWGIPSHFGYDPTCFIFRGNFDTSCWTDAFKPTIRIFSTLGQPAWLAAYLSLLIPIAMAVGITKNQEPRTKNHDKITSYFLLLTSILFYAGLVYTDTRGGFIGFWIANIAFWSITYFKKVLTRDNFKKYFLIFNLAFLIFNFLQGAPISQIEKFTLPSIIKNAEPIPTSQTNQINTQPATALGGTDSGKIRLFVWSGAIDAWLEKPLIGHGVETFAYAYYEHKPIGHNLTSEWDYLYNKAHNEYLNYLTTTGILGLGSYLAIIGVFIYKTLLNGYMVKWLKKNHSTIQPSNHKFDDQEKATTKLLTMGLVSGYLSILISNFFGFSVVIINLYFFLIPAFVFVINDLLNPKNSLAFPKSKPALLKKPTSKQWFFLVVLFLVFSFQFSVLANHFRADMAYANGQALNQGGGYQEAYPFLVKAVSLTPGEPVYKDELSINMGTLAAALYLQNEASSAASIRDQAIALNDSVVETHPNNIVFWKSRVRLFYALAQGDPENEKEYLDRAFEAVEKSAELAPTDAKISYNLGILLGQRGDLDGAITELKNTIRLKPNYRDAYYALALFYNESGNRDKAIESLRYILENINPNDQTAKETLESWK